MAEPDPIKQLQHLLDDPGKVLERISRIQSAIGSIRDSSSNAPEALADSPGEASPAFQAKRPYDALLRIVRGMQAHVEQRLRPLALLSIQSETERVFGLAEQEQGALNQCIAQLDQTLLTCVDRISESQEVYDNLTAINDRLTQLGATPEALPDFSLNQDANALLASRLESLRRKGKI